jgi:hypothetical protein
MYREGNRQVYLTRSVGAPVTAKALKWPFATLETTTLQHSPSD